MIKDSSQKNVSIINGGMLLVLGLVIASIAHLFHAPASGFNAYLTFFAVSYIIIIMISIFGVIKLRAKQKIIPVITILIAAALLGFDLFGLSMRGLQF